ncbi:MAG: YqgE/AlgH family protein [Paramuribaculum sp.]|nr:YqgE/AlgH family protein [Paramuribaculum sp.]
MTNIDKQLFNININCDTDPNPGSLLISEPFLREEYFHHSVITLIEYAPNASAMGVVMNHPSDHSLQDLLDGISIQDSITVYRGGPLSCNRLFFIHTLGREIIPDSNEIVPGLYIGGDFNAMKQYVNTGYPIDGHIRFFIGYSGWSANQLDEELNSKVWAVTNCTDHKDLLTGSNDHFWHRYVRALGQDFRGWRLHPLIPQCN